MSMKAEIRKLADAADAAAEALRDALQSFYDEKSERWQGSEAGEDWQALIDQADEAQGLLGSISEAVNT